MKTLVNILIMVSVGAISWFLGYTYGWYGVAMCIPLGCIAGSLYNA